MSQIILQTKNLTKRYGLINAVDHINMTIKKGDIYGLIGQNGAGKTTLIRIITSLISPTEGEISLFGKSDYNDLQKEREKIGAVVETPAFFPNLTAYQNLEYYCIQKGNKDKNIINQVLNTVNLTNTGKKKFKNFSLGMKQRLGIALSIMNNPEFLILDEPINGLDPMGIIEVREVIKRLNESGTTILISSHILTELAQVATMYGIVSNGKLIKELTKEELYNECRKSVYTLVNDSKKAADVLREKLNTQNFEIISDFELRIFDFYEDTSIITQAFVENGIRVNAIYQTSENLENYFINLVGGNKHE